MQWESMLLLHFWCVYMLCVGEVYVLVGVRACMFACGCRGQMLFGCLSSFDFGCLLVITTFILIFKIGF